MRPASKSEPAQAKHGNPIVGVWNKKRQSDLRIPSGSSGSRWSRVRSNCQILTAGVQGSPLVPNMLSFSGKKKFRIFIQLSFLCLCLLLYKIATSESLEKMLKVGESCSLTIVCHIKLCKVGRRLRLRFPPVVV